MAAAAVAANADGGLASFEKELICSICTEVLYQPLTILNCLHTFCGSCLKEWFSHQHRKASSSRSTSSHANPYSCPTCRAEVVDVQHNATVSNLLELFLAADPSRDRSQEEKDEMNRIYKPDGTRPRDKILPKVERRRERRTRREDSEARRDRQMVEEARARSLRDFEQPSASATSLAPPQADRNRSASAERDERRHRRRERERQRGNPSLEIPSTPGRQDRERTASPPASSPRHPDAVETRQREHRMSHQTSLRSLVSASESGTGTGDSLDEAHIMQEIIDAGLLGDIDVDSLTEAEQDALAERIAELYHQMVHQRLTRRPEPTSPPQTSSTVSGSSPEAAQHAPRSYAERRTRSNSAQPPVSDGETAPASADTRARSHSSRPQQPPPSAIARSNSNGSSSVTIHHRRRTSDQSRQIGAAARSRHSSVERPPASSSSANLVEGRERRPSMNTAARTNTDPTRSPPRASEAWLRAGREARGLQAGNGVSPGPSPAHSSRVQTMPVDKNTATVTNPITNSTTLSELDSSPITTSAPTINRYDEPSISCFRCNKSDIQYDIFRHCRACKVDLCMRCYRTAKGCKHWYGFGHAADINFESAKTTNEDTERPHVLIGRQYLKPSASTMLEARPSARHQEQYPKTTTSNPQTRLQEGHFCDRCGTFANAQFWICDICNDGEWGFCKSCVQTHHCCTHPLLPVAYVSQSSFLNHAMTNMHLNTSTLQPTPVAPSNPTSRPLTPNSPSTTTATHSRRNSGHDYLSINVNCDMCHSIIFPSSPRYHCPSHITPGFPEPGDYDICQPCYTTHIHHSRMRRDGHSSADITSGWRKCPQGHRMIILAFETSPADPNDPDPNSTPNHDGGIRRIVKADLVGGWRMTESDMRTWNIAHGLHNTTSPPSSPPPTTTHFPTFNRGTWTWKDDTTGTRKTRSRASTIESSNPTPTSSALPPSNPRFPPDGGLGAHGVAYYAYWPDEGPEGADELRLPRGASVSEIEDVNGDWWSGVYAGDVGVFPFGQVVASEEIQFYAEFRWQQSLCVA